MEGRIISHEKSRTLTPDEIDQVGGAGFKYSEPRWTDGSGEMGGQLDAGGADYDM